MSRGVLAGIVSRAVLQHAPVRRLCTPPAREALKLGRLAGEEAAAIYPKLGPHTPAVVGGIQIDGIPRYPNTLSVGAALRGTDWVCTGFFATSGAITAATCGLDLFGCTFIGSVTALGGGTIRDAIILHKQPFWIEEVEYLWISVCAALAAFFLFPKLPSNTTLSAGLKNEAGDEGPLMWWGDAIGVGAFAVIGVMNGCRMCVSPGLCVLSGVSSATFGGLTRDLICGLPGQGSMSRGRILHSKKDLYATTALAGALTYMTARRLRLPVPVRIVSGVAAAVMLRWTASTYGLGLPTWDQPDWKVQRMPSELERDEDGKIIFSDAEAAMLAQVLAAVEKQKTADKRRAS